MICWHTDQSTSLVLCACVGILCYSFEAMDRRQQQRQQSCFSNFTMSRLDSGDPASGHSQALEALAIRTKSTSNGATMDRPVWQWLAGVAGWQTNSHLFVPDWEPFECVSAVRPAAVTTAQESCFLCALWSAPPPPPPPPPPIDTHHPSVAAGSPKAPELFTYLRRPPLFEVAELFVLCKPLGCK
jgi:hypothetical protein